MTLASLTEYARSGRGLITTAAPYLKEMQACLSGDGACPTKMFGLQSSDVWTKMLVEADERLTYSDPDAAIKSIKSEKAELSDGSILDYDAILSTSQKDRDGDILRTEGMQLEKNMPLLWQHIWSQPIGKMLSVVEQNSSHVVCKYAVADTEMGRDAAKLLRMGALRKSHGFFPIPGFMEALDGEKSADGMPSGFDIKRCQVYESSVVSIPANSGAKVLRTYEKEASAIFTAVEEKQLESEAFSHWAKGLYDNRQRFFPGADFSKLEKMMGEVKEKLESISTKSEKYVETDSRPKCKGCEDGYTDDSGTCDCCGKVASKSAYHGFIKAYDAVAIEKMMGMPEALPGSFELIQRKLAKNIEEYLESKDIDVGDYEYTHLLATFADSCVVCKRNYRKDTETCYRIGWNMEDGKPALTGDVEKVEIEASVVSKALDESGARIKELNTDGLWSRLVAKAIGGETVREETIKNIKQFVDLLEREPEQDQDPLAALFGS